MYTLWKDSSRLVNVHTHHLTYIHVYIFFGLSLPDYLCDSFIDRLFTVNQLYGNYFIYIITLLCLIFITTLWDIILILQMKKWLVGDRTCLFRYIVVKGRASLVSICSCFLFKHINTSNFWKTLLVPCHLFKISKQVSIKKLFSFLTFSTFQVIFTWFKPFKKEIPPLAFIV